jgi:hypothetical protein
MKNGINKIKKISMKEIWKDIKGYEGVYQISNLGRVKSLRRNKILKTRKTFDNYERVNLSYNALNKTYKIHRLVAQTFIDNTFNKQTVNHINGVKSDNRAINLEWMSFEENYNHYLKNKKNERGLG